MSSNSDILQILKSSTVALKSSDIAKNSGIVKKDVDKAIKYLISEGLINSPKRCFYEIKK